MKLAVRVPEKFPMKAAKLLGRLSPRLFSRLHLAQKLMLIYSIALGISIITFASQLIREVVESTEQSFLNDTKNLLQESVYDVENNVDVCYRAVSSLTSDYDIISYINDWNSEDSTDIFDFSMELNKKVEQIVFLSTDVYQYRIYINNEDFPEIGSIVYNAGRLPIKDSLNDILVGSTTGYWLVNHPENNYNTSTRVRRNVVSLYMPLRYSNAKNPGIVEVSMPVESFFRHVFSQAGNKNLFAFVRDSGGRVIYNGHSEFLTDYGLDEAGLDQLLKNYDLSGKSRSVLIRVGKIPMRMVYDYVDRLGCSVYYIVSNEDFTKGLMDTTFLIIAESLVSLLVLSVLTYFLTRIVFKKMKQIIVSMRKVGEGKFGISVDTAGQDEMSEMAYHFNKMSNQLGNLVSEVIKKQEAKKNAEIHALFSQINSHFIINTLENIRMMAEVDSRFEIADAITSLGKLLRYGLKWTSEYSMLREEIEYIVNYINLINIRYDFVIRLETDIPAALMTYRVLKISLQPIVENSIHRGIVSLGRDGLLTIRAFEIPEYTVIEITDDGAGMDEERLENVRMSLLPDTLIETQGVSETKDINGAQNVNGAQEKTEELEKGRTQSKGGTGIGLKNVNERIRLVYGERYGIQIDSVKDEYTRVTIRLPASQQS